MTAHATEPCSEVAGNPDGEATVLASDRLAFHIWLGGSGLMWLMALLGLFLNR
jgi:hypothetical protein